MKINTCLIGTTMLEAVNEEYEKMVADVPSIVKKWFQIWIGGGGIDVYGR